MYAGMCMHKRCIPLVKVSATGHCHPLDKYHSLIRVSSVGQNVIIWPSTSHSLIHWYHPMVRVSSTCQSIIHLSEYHPDSDSLFTKFYNKESVSISGKHINISKPHWHSSTSIVTGRYPSAPPKQHTCTYLLMHATHSFTHSFTHTHARTHTHTMTHTHTHTHTIASNVPM